MSMLKVGSTYAFKTLTFYYVGTVTALFPTHAALSNATEVYETGANSSFFAGTIQTHERVPDGTLVPLCGGITIFPMERVLR